jgi:type I restriction enzyme S subunit
LYGGPYPFIQTGDVKAANFYVTEYSQTYGEEGLAQSKMWPKDTLCITIAANIAETAILGLDACFPDSVVGFIADEKKSDVRFVKYRLDTLKDQYRRFTQGAAQDNLSIEKLLSIKLSVPKPPVQRRIASILSAYDELIENNLRRIKLLEESARLLYNEWFVRLRFPGYEHTRIVNGVPEGWEKKNLADVCDEVREAVSPRDVESDTPYIGLEHIPRRSITLSTWAEAQEVTSSKHRFCAGDILFGKIRPYFHKVGIAFVDGVASSDAIVIRPKADSVRSLVLLIVSSDRFVAEASQKVKEGSKMPRADWKIMREYAIALPPHALLDTLNSYICPITQQLKLLTMENRKLKQARDILLPKLMSGEIKVGR